MIRKIIIRFIIPLLIATVADTSCIFDTPQGDEFYRTLWESEEVPLGPFDVSRLTLEFLCNGSVSIKADDSRYYSYGTYSPDEDIAALQNLKLFLDGYEISFIEAHRNGDTLFLLWRVNDAVYPFTTAMHRLSSYSQ